MDILNMEVIQEETENPKTKKKSTRTNHSKKFHSLTTKLRILKEYDKIKSVKTICEKYDLGVTTLRRWLQIRSTLEEPNFSSTIIGKPGNNLKECKNSFQILEEALFLWYCLVTKGGIELDVSQIRGT